MLREAARLLWRHWPVLLVLYLLGMAGREISIYLAVEGSGVNVWLGAALLPFAPLSLMIAVLLMLDAVGPSLWHGPVRQDKLTLLAGALIPFLTVYSAQGYLRADRNRFLNEAVTDEFQNDSYLFDASTIHGRTIADLAPATVIMLIVAVLLVRRALDWLGWTERSRVVRLLAAWLEVAWMTWLASMLLAEVDRLQTWTEQRVFVDWFVDAGDQLVSWLGPVATVLGVVWGWVVALLSDLDALVVLPLAWLTTGAVVYGGTLANRTFSVGGRLSRPVDRVTRARERVTALPQPVQGWLAAIGKTMFARFVTLWGGLRTLTVGGVVPMILFCLAFLTSRYAEAATSELIRWVVGPQAAADMVTLSSYVTIASTAVSMLLQVTLVAAAVDRLLISARRLALAQPDTSEVPTTP